MRSVRKNNNEAARRLDREEEYRRSINERVAGEPDLNVQLQILNQAIRSRPHDDSFQVERQRVQAKLQQVADLADKARAYESSGHFDHALEEWLCVGDIYPAFAGLPENLARVKGLWRKQRDEVLEELDLAVTDTLRQGEQKRAEELLNAAQAEFQDEPHYGELKRRHKAAANSHREVALLLASVQKAESAQRYGEIPGLFQKAAVLSKEIESLRVRVFNVMIATASAVLSHDWRVARQLVEEASRDGNVPPSLSEAIEGEEREEIIRRTLAEDRENPVNPQASYERVAQLLAKYPAEARLDERLTLLAAILANKRKQEEERACAAELVRLDLELGKTTDHQLLWNTHSRAKNLAAPFAHVPAIADLVYVIGDQVARFENAAEHLSRDRIQDCFEICDGVLRSRPDHQLFQHLRGQAADRQRELGEEYFDRVERWLMGEPDLFKRRQIIEGAQEQYPFDSRYAEELQQIERERALAESLAERARDFEKRGQLAEALGQWRQLRNIHPAFVGLEEQIAACESVLNRQQRKDRAQRLFTRGRECLANEQFAEGYEMLAEAARNGQDVPEILRPVAPDLVASARIVLPSSPRLADALVMLAQDLDETLHVPKDFRVKISEASKAADLAECLSAIHADHDAGDFESALTRAGEFLARFPGSKEIECVRDRSIHEIERLRRQQLRAQALNDFQELEDRAVHAGAPELLGS